MDCWVRPGNDGEGVAEFGAVLPKPGGEAAWLEQLPGELREKLKAAA